MIFQSVTRATFYIPMRNDRDVMVNFEPGPSRFQGWITPSIG